MLMQLLFENPHWFWLTLGSLLLASELLGAGGYSLWSGISALSIGALVWLMPIRWEWQWVYFSVLTVLTALLWWYWLKKGRKTNHFPLLNQRSRQLIGTRSVLIEGLDHGHGRLKIGDSTWRVEAQESIPAGAVVEVIDVQGITLKVRLVPPGDQG